MKKAIILLVTLCFIVSCWALPAKADTLELAGKPWVNSDIFGCWPSERPALEDQYELYVNFDHYQEALAKGDGAQSNYYIRSEKMLLNQILELCNDSEKRDPESESIRILYGFYTDKEAIERDGFASLMAYVNRVKAVENLDELTRLMQEPGFLFGSPFFSLNLALSQENTYNVLFTKNSVVDMRWPTDEEYEINPEAVPEKDTAGVRQNLLRMEYSEEEASRLLEKILWFDDFNLEEYEMSERESELGNKPAMTLEEIREICPPIGAMLVGLGMLKEAETDEVYCSSIMDLAAFNKAYTEDNLDLFKAIIALSMYTAAKDILGPTVFPEMEGNSDPFAFFSQLPRVLLPQAYVHNFVPEERIKEYYQLVDDIKEAMHVRIEQSNWASQETKEKAFEKLDKMVAVSLLYLWESDCESLLQGLRSCKTLLDAGVQCMLFERKCEMGYAGLESFRGNRWASGESPLAIGGKYYPMENAFYIGAGALTGEVYNGASRETVLATIGYHIGHELSHGFDINGMMYDAEGAQNPVASESDMARYWEKANTISESASRIKLLDDLNVLGGQQLGEIIADIEGLRLVLDLAKKEEQFNYDAFFRAYARLYFGYYSDREDYFATFSSEVHPSLFVRANFTVQFMEEFYETYPSVVEGTPMYLPPEERELIW